MCLKEKINRNSESGKSMGLFHRRRRAENQEGSRKHSKHQLCPHSTLCSVSPLYSLSGRPKSNPVIQHPTMSRQRVFGAVGRNSSCCFQIISHRGKRSPDTQLCPSSCFVELGGYNENHHWLISLDGEWNGTTQVNRGWQAHTSGFFASDSANVPRHTTKW